MEDAKGTDDKCAWLVNLIVAFLKVNVAIEEHFRPSTLLPRLMIFAVLHLITTAQNVIATEKFRGQECSLLGQSAKTDFSRHPSSPCVLAAKWAEHKLLKITDPKITRRPLRHSLKAGIRVVIKQESGSNNRHCFFLKWFPFWLLALPCARFSVVYLLLCHTFLHNRHLTKMSLFNRFNLGKFVINMRSLNILINFDFNVSFEIFMLALGNPFNENW